MVSGSSIRGLNNMVTNIFVLGIFFFCCLGILI